MVHKALPRQLMPRAVTEDTLKMMERRALGRMVEGFRRDTDVNWAVKWEK